MKNKKAMEDALVKLVIAALCIVALVYLAISIYSVVVSERAAREKAERTLDQIIAKINGLADQETDRYIILAPNNWGIMVRKKAIVICKIEGVRWADIKNEEDRFGNCSIRGLVKFANYYLELERPYLDFRVLPIEIMMTRDRNTVKIQTSVEKRAEKMWEEMLGHRIDSYPKPLEKIINETITLLKQGESISDHEDWIEENIEDYFGKMDIEKIFRLKEDSIEWHFEIEKEGEYNPIVWLQRKGYISEMLLLRKVVYEDETYRATISFRKAQKSSGWI
jgi:hypothetical protein